MAAASTGPEESTRAEQSVQAFRDALEKSVTISRERLQEVVDDAVKRGRMTRGDAEEMVGRLATRGREQAEDLIAQLESLLSQVREVPDKAERLLESYARVFASSPSVPPLPIALQRAVRRERPGQ